PQPTPRVRNQAWLKPPARNQCSYRDESRRQRALQPGSNPDPTAPGGESDHLRSVDRSYTNRDARGEPSARRPGIVPPVRDAPPQNEQTADLRADRIAR